LWSKLASFLLFFIPILVQAAKEEPLDVSYQLTDVETGTVIEGHNANVPFPLASVSKLFTFYYALHNLGPEYRFHTEIYYDGDIEDGVLKGDLYLVGYGDPYLTSSHIISLIHQVQKQGINSITGEFYLDDTALPFTKRLSPIGLEDQADNPSISALNAEFNRFNVWTRYQAPSPPLDHIAIKKSKFNKSSKFSLQESNDHREIWVQKKRARHKSIEELPTRNSTLYTGELMRFLAQMQGLKLPPPKQKRLASGSTLVAHHDGLTLERLIALGIEYSNNLIAEVILQSAAKRQVGSLVSIEQAAQTMIGWMQAMLPKVDWSKIHLVNGSGLSHENKASAQQLNQYLREVSDTHFQGRSFWSLLSISGHSGGLRRRLKKPEYAYRVYAKTGTLHYVHSLAGFLVARSGKRYAFSIQHRNEKNLKILASEPHSKKAERLRRRGSAWYRKVKRQMDKRLRKWIDQY
jgi:D-alanyl-D-alanine carboxypeptidase/D-alanyl-D-alanine-endopeptidase (penicillin-binding protein 4)